MRHLRILALVLVCCAVPVHAEDKDSAAAPSSGMLSEPHDHSGIAPGGIEAVGAIIEQEQASFQEVLEHLGSDRFEEAEAVLSKRIEQLKRLYENRVMMVDRYPKLADCLTLSYFLNLALARPERSRLAADYLVKTLRFSQSEVLQTRFEEFVQDAKKDPAGFRSIVKQMAESMQMAVDLERAAPQQDLE